VDVVSPDADPLDPWVTTTLRGEGVYEGLTAA
jgi:hypothetical protein